MKDFQAQSVSKCIYIYLPPKKIVGLEPDFSGPVPNILPLDQEFGFKY